MFRGAHVSSWCIPPKPEDFLRTVADFHLGNLKKRLLLSSKGPCDLPLGRMIEHPWETSAVNLRGPWKLGNAILNPQLHSSIPVEENWPQVYKNHRCTVPTHLPFHTSCLTPNPRPVNLWFPANTGCAALGGLSCWFWPPRAINQP